MIYMFVFFIYLFYAHTHTLPKRPTPRPGRNLSFRLLGPLRSAYSHSSFYG